MDREELLDVATKVLLENNGASMQEIATAAGIGRTTLHRHFANREDLLRELYLAALRDAEIATTQSRLEEGTTVEALKRVIDQYMPIGHRFHFLLSQYSLEGDPEIKAREDLLLEPFESLMRRGQQEGTLRKDLTTRWMVEVLTSLLFTAWTGIAQGYVASREAPKLVLTTFLTGVTANQP